MNHRLLAMKSGLMLLLFTSVGTWAFAGDVAIPTYTDDTASRLIASPAVGSADTADKDYGLGDFDADGDMDVLVARRVGLPGFNNDDPLRNTLLMNEGGILVNRTAEFAADLLVPQRSREVLVADFNNDGLPDAMIGDGTSNLPPLLLNQGFDAKDDWLGFSLADPALLPSGFNVDVWTLSAGNLVGDRDGFPDVFVGVRIGNDRLLVNQGESAGVWMGFADESSRLGTNAQTSATRSSRITDINQDGDQDIVSGVTFPEGEVRLLANNGTGQFTATPQVIFSDFAYNFNLGDLDGNGDLDLLGVRNGFDQYRENLGAGINDSLLVGPVLTVPNSNGFGSNCIVGDINGDGTTDFMVADLDQELPADCSRRLKIFVNSGISPYLSDAYPVPMPWTPNGTSDVALIDFDGDQDMDLLIGHCNGQSVFLQNGSPCTTDLNDDGASDAADLAILLGAWGPAPGDPADLNNDGSVDAADLAVLLGGWGLCT